MRTWQAAVLIAGCAALVLAAGCRTHMPHSFTLGTGDVGRTHAKPAEGGYYTDWDPWAATLEVRPAREVNPVRTQHVLVATVKDKDGKGLPNRRVEWIIPDGGVGAIVEVDESGWRASRGHKVTNRYAISHTNNSAHVLTRGNDDPADDIHLEAGQTWCVVTSAVEGTTHVVAYAPGIHDWQRHKVFVTKVWSDIAWKLPPAARNRVGTRHELHTKVMRHSDGAPLEGYEVTYRIAGGPDASLLPGEEQSVTVRTGADGIATATLQQSQPVAGENPIEVTIVRPEGAAAGRQATVVHVGRTSKTWVAPRIGIRKSAPEQAMMGETFSYGIVVSNPAEVSAEEVVVTDELPEGIQYVSSSPEAEAEGQTLTWSLGSLPGGQERSLRVNVKAAQKGRFENRVSVRTAEGLSDRAAAVTRVVQPELAITKSAPEEVLLCDRIPYRFVVTNRGDAPATNVQFRDQLPEGLLWKGEHRGLQARIDRLEPGRSREISFQVQASKTGTYTNTAKVTADGGLSAQASAKTVVRAPDLTVTKTGPEMRFVGRPATYTIKLTNEGDGIARNTVLTDKVPSGCTFISADKGGELRNGQVVWQLGTLRPDGSATVTVRMRVTEKGTVRNTVTAKADCSEASGEATTTVRGIPAVLLELVDSDDPIEVGANETYVVTVTNQGSAQGTNIQVTCTLPAEMEFVSADGPTREQVRQKVVTFQPLKSLDPKAKATYKIVAKGTEAGDVRFRVSLASDQIETPVEETESTHIYSDSD